VPLNLCHFAPFFVPRSWHRRKTELFISSSRERTK
jgi:hypothetical protein